MLEDVHAEDFYRTLQELGETVTFVYSKYPKFDLPNLPDGHELKQYKPKTIKRKASIVPNRLNKALATTEGTFFYTGNMTFDSMWEQEHFIGQYFIRERQPHSKLLLLSVFPETTTEKIGLVHVVECNNNIDIIDHFDVSEETYEKTPVYKAHNVPTYTETYMGAPTTMPTGTIDRISMNVTMPANYMMTTENVIVGTRILYDEEAGTSVIKKAPYQISNIDEGLMAIVDGDVVGTVKCSLRELSEDEIATL